MSMSSRAACLLALLAAAAPTQGIADPLEVALGGPSPSPAFVGYPTTLTIQVSPTFSPSTVTGITGRLEGVASLRPFALVGHDCPGDMAEVLDNGKTVIEWTGIPALPGTDEISCSVEVRAERLQSVTARLQMDCDTCADPSLNRATAPVPLELPPNVVATLSGNPFPSVGPAAVTLRLENTGTGNARNVLVALFGSPELFDTMSADGVGKCLDGLGQDFESVTFAITQLDPGEVVICPFSFEMPDAGRYSITGLASGESESGLPDPESADNSETLNLRGTDFVVDFRFSGFPDAAPGNGLCADRNGNCSIRAAVEESNALAGYQRITVPYNAAGYYLGSVTNALVITDPVTIAGDPDPTTGALPWITREDGDDAPLFEVDTGSVVQTVFANLDLRGNPTRTLSVDGAVVRQASGGLWIRESRISGGDTTGSGGGLRGSTGLRLSGVQFENNTAGGAGGGLAVFGINDGERDVLIEGVAFDGNEASSGGGAYFINAEAIVRRSSFTANTANQGGGLYVSTLSDVAIDNSTISDNVAQLRGGGIYHAAGSVRLTFTTLTYNDAGPGSLTEGEGGGVYMVFPISTRIRHSILAYNTAQTTTGTIFGFKKSGECLGTITSELYNTVVGIGADPDCALAPASPTDNLTGSPALSDLMTAPNGTKYRRLLRVNQDIDQAGPLCDDVQGTVFFEDQLRGPRRREGDGRGEARCDKGAVEASTLSLALDVAATAGADWNIELSEPYGLCDTPACAFYFIPVGTTITLTPNPGANAEFSGWGGDCAAAGLGPCTLNSLRSSANVTAGFGVVVVEDGVFSDGFED